MGETNEAGLNQHQGLGRVGESSVENHQNYQMSPICPDTEMETNQSHSEVFNHNVMDPGTLSLMARLFPGLSPLYWPSSWPKIANAETGSNPTADESDGADLIQTMVAKMNRNKEQIQQTPFDQSPPLPSAIVSSFLPTSSLNPLGLTGPSDGSSLAYPTGLNSLTQSLPGVSDITGQFPYSLLPATMGSEYMKRFANLSRPPVSDPNQTVNNCTGDLHKSSNGNSNLPLSPFTTAAAYLMNRNDSCQGEVKQLTPVTTPGPYTFPVSIGQSSQQKTDEDFCEICQKHFCNKYYLRKHKADVHGIHTEPYSHSRRRETAQLQATGQKIGVQSPGIVDRSVDSRPHSVFDERTSKLPRHSHKFTTNQNSAKVPDSMPNISPLLMSSQPMFDFTNTLEETPHHHSTNTAMSRSIDHVDAQIPMTGANLMNCIDPMLSANYYLMALANSGLPVPIDPTMFASNMKASSHTELTNNNHTPTSGLSDVPLLPITGLNSKPSIQEVKCDQCQKVFCSQYFLHVHKLNQHMGVGVDVANGGDKTVKPEPTNPSSMIPDCQNMSRNLANIRIKDAQFMSMNHNDWMIETNDETKHEETPIRGTNGSELKPSMDAFKSSMVAAKLADRVTCELCKKELCNKYFLRTHKIRVHGVSPKDVGGPPMRNPPVVPQSMMSAVPVTNGMHPNKGYNHGPVTVQSGYFPQSQTGTDVPSNLSMKDSYSHQSNLPEETTVRGLQSHMNGNPSYVRTTSSSDQLDVQQFNTTKSGLEQNWSSFLPPGSNLNGLVGMETSEMTSATHIIYCPICDQPIGPRLFLPSHLSDVHLLNPINPAFFLNMLRAKSVPLTEFTAQAEFETKQAEMDDGMHDGDGDVMTNKSNDDETDRYNSGKDMTTRQRFQSVDSFLENDGTRLHADKNLPVPENLRTSTTPSETNEKDVEMSDYSTTMNSNPINFSTTLPDPASMMSELPPSSSSSIEDFSAAGFVMTTTATTTTTNTNSQWNLILSSGGLKTGMGLEQFIPDSISPTVCLSSVIGSASNATTSIPYSYYNNDSTSNHAHHTMPIMCSSAMGFPSITSSTSSGYCFPTSSSNSPYTPTSGMQSMGLPRKSPNQMRVLCDICNKWICNKYFLRTHKANKHGITDQSLDAIKSGTVRTSSSSVTGKSPSHSPSSRPMALIHEMMETNEANEAISSSMGSTEAAAILMPNNPIGKEAALIPATMPGVAQLTQMWKMAYGANLANFGAGGLVNTGPVPPFQTAPFPMGFPPMFNPALTMPGVFAAANPMMMTMMLMNPAMITSPTATTTAPSTTIDALNTTGLHDGYGIESVSGSGRHDHQKMWTQNSAGFDEHGAESSTSDDLERLRDTSGEVSSIRDDPKLPLNLSLKSPKIDITLGLTGDMGPRRRKTKLPVHRKRQHEYNYTPQHQKARAYVQRAIRWATVQQRHSNPPEEQSDGTKKFGIRMRKHKIRPLLHRRGAKSSWCGHLKNANHTKFHKRRFNKPFPCQKSPTEETAQTCTIEQTRVDPLQHPFPCTLCPNDSPNRFANLDLLIQHLSHVHRGQSDVTDSEPIQSNESTSDQRLFHISQLVTSSSTDFDALKDQSVTSVIGSPCFTSSSIVQATGGGTSVTNMPTQSPDTDRYGFTTKTPLDPPCLRDLPPVSDMLHQSIFIPVNSYGESLTTI